MTKKAVEKIASDILVELAQNPEATGILVITCIVSSSENLTEALCLPSIEKALKTRNVIPVIRVHDDTEKELIGAVHFTSLALVVASEMLAKFVEKNPHQIRESLAEQAAQMMGSMSFEDRLKLLKKQFNDKP